VLFVVQLWTALQAVVFLVAFHLFSEGISSQKFEKSHSKMNKANCQAISPIIFNQSFQFEQQRLNEFICQTQ